jgi:hypothetical protein
MNLQTMKYVQTNLFNEISRYGGLDTHSIQTLREDGRHTLTIFTDRTEYRIDVRLPSEGRPNGGLACMASARKPRAGETWTRGNDLPDGPLSLDTWHRILASIVSYEMVKVHRLQEPVVVVSENVVNEPA